MHKYKYMHGILRRYVLPKDSIFYKAGYIGSRYQGRNQNLKQVSQVFLTIFTFVYL